MKVSDLIKRLQKCDPEASVVFTYWNCDSQETDNVCEVRQTVIVESDPEFQRTFVELKG